MVYDVNQLTRGCTKNMFTYEPLRNLLEERNISFRELRRELGIHSVAAVQLNNDSGIVSLEIIDRICTYLDVPIEQVIRHIPEK